MPKLTALRHDKMTSEASLFPRSKNN